MVNGPNQAPSVPGFDRSAFEKSAVWDYSSLADDFYTQVWIPAPSGGLLSKAVWRKENNIQDPASVITVDPNGRVQVGPPPKQK